MRLRPGILWIFAVILTVWSCGTPSLVPGVKPADERIVYATPLRSVITAMDYGEGVFVVGHQNPDCDAVCSAITYADLLRRLGIGCVPAVTAGIVDRKKAPAGTWQ